jgi:hypothetical protein
VTPSEHTRPSDATRDAERDDAEVGSHADREPTKDEEERAEKIEADPEVADHEKEMAERGAHQEGEGRLP